MKREEIIYEILKDIPLKTADDTITNGTLVLEGGAFRGLYQEGVLDCLMEKGYNFNTIIGVSAGALNGVNYITRQIGRSAHINIRYRHDKRYLGVNAYLKTKGKSLFNFDFTFGSLPDVPDLDIDLLKNTRRKLIVVATNLETGEANYYDNKREDFLECVKASATLPYFSRPVLIENVPHLDGGCDDRIPYNYAINNGYEKIVVIKTRDKNFRISKSNFNRRYLVTKRWYSKYPLFSYKLSKTDDNYNVQLDELDKLEQDKKVFVISPSKPINIKLLEGDLYKLKDLYVLGYNDCLNILDDLKAYLSK